MTTITYLEPIYINIGKSIVTAFESPPPKKGNIVSLLSDAMAALRQFGPAGMKQWIELDYPKRGFILTGMTNAGCKSLTSENFDEAWQETGCLMQILRAAKYYAKTR